MTKTLSFAAIHFTVAFTIAYLITGSWVAGSLTALIEPCVNTVAYHLHERAWARREGAMAAVTTPLMGHAHG